MVISTFTLVSLSSSERSPETQNLVNLIISEASDDNRVIKAFDREVRSCKGDKSLIMVPIDTQTKWSQGEI